MALKEKAKEVLKIIDEGGFYNPAGKWMDIKDEVDFSINNSKTYEPDAFPTLNAGIKNAAQKLRKKTLPAVLPFIPA